MNRRGRGFVSLLGIIALALIVLWATGAFARTTSGSNTPAAHTATQATEGRDPDSGLPWIAEQALPAEARTTLGLIDKGGPYPYPQSDDQTFSNAERILPRKERGYYREYTVKTPGSRDRGARRIVRGAAGELYYTDDHYQSFARIKR